MDANGREAVMADYLLMTSDEDGPVRRTADGACIPADPNNRDWADYQEWLEVEGNAPDPYVPPET
jgi:hypothetical protein